MTLSSIIYLKQMNIIQNRAFEFIFSWVKVMRHNSFTWINKNTRNCPGSTTFIKNELISEHNRDRAAY